MKFYKPRLILFIFISFVYPNANVFSTEILLRNGEAYLVEEVVEREDTAFFQWKGKSYRIPKDDIQRIDTNKKGKDISYQYVEIALSDGSMIRGIVVESKGSKFVIKTDLGFAELDSSKLVSRNAENLHPEPSDRYIQNIASTNGRWRGGISASGYATLGSIASIYPALGGGGFFLERFSSQPRHFFGVLSEYSYGQISSGHLSLWNNSMYYGRSFAESSPYFLLGAGATSVSSTDANHQYAGTDAQVLGEFGWSWERENSYLLRIGIRSQCILESQSSLCQAGLRFSWGIYL